MASTVDVVIPTYNRRDLVVRCLVALNHQTRLPDRIIVVDDASRDDTVAFVTRAFPWVHVVTRERNGQFARAANTGLRASRAEFVALLNNDASPEPGWLEALVTAAEADSALGSCASKIVFADRPSIVNSAGIFVRLDGGTRDVGYGEPDGPRFESDREVLGATGGALLFRREALNEVGFFDEDLIAYEEDADWALRAQLLGYRCRCVAAARVHHAAHATYGTANPRTIFLQCRNLPLVPIKDFPTGVLLAMWPRILALQAYQVARLAARGAAAPAIRGKLSALANLPKFWRKRVTVRGLDTDPDGFCNRLRGLGG